MADNDRKPRTKQELEEWLKRFDGATEDEKQSIITKEVQRMAADKSGKE